MKRYFVLAIAAVAIVAACNKQETPSPDESTEKVKVEFGTKNLSIHGSTVKAKAVGGVDEWNDALTLKVYGFQADISDFTSDAFIDNVAAAAPASGTSGAIEVYNPAISGQNEPFYYSGTAVYNFYGYFTDDAVVSEPVREPTRVYVPFEINGGQDLMVATTDKSADVAGTNVSVDRAYSSYAARRDVHPNLIFKHQLSRFKFEVLTGSMAAQNIYVTDLTLDSRYKGNLVVVGAQGLADVDDETTPFQLCELDGGVLKPLTTMYPYVNSTSRGGVKLNDITPIDADNETVSAEERAASAKSIGESILAIPGSASYKLQVSYYQSDVQAEAQPFVYEITPAMVTPVAAGTTVTAFEPGKEYKISIVIYGLEDVQITATLEDWVEGGNVTIDPDEF